MKHLSRSLIAVGLALGLLLGQSSALAVVEAFTAACDHCACKGRSECCVEEADRDGQAAQPAVPAPVRSAPLDLICSFPADALDRPLSASPDRPAASLRFPEPASVPLYLRHRSLLI